MFEVRQVLVEDPIPSVKFACDISVCKGACCTLEGGKGAPLLDEEIEEIEKAFQIVKQFLPPEHLATISSCGLYEGGSGYHTTMCHDNHACVFVVYEKGIARCSIEKIYIEGKTNWRKPVSCYLFPIRVDDGVIKRLRYERIAECNPALHRGEQEQINLWNFLKEPLIRAFGTSWYNDFSSMCESEKTDPLINNSVTSSKL